MIDITALLIVITVAIVATAAYIAPIVKASLKAKLGADTTAIISKVADTVVQAAEEAARSGLISKSLKYETAAEWLKIRLEKMGITFDPEEVRSFIDSSVWRQINQFKDDSEAK